MDDKTLLNIVIAIVIVGLAALLILSYYSVIPEKTVNQLTSSDVSTAIRSNGTIKSVIYYNTSTLLKIEQKCVMDAVIFSNDQNFTIGQNVKVEGTVQEYNGKMELLIDKITT